MSKMRSRIFEILMPTAALLGIAYAVTSSGFKQFPNMPLSSPNQIYNSSNIGDF